MTYYTCNVTTTKGKRSGAYVYGIVTVTATNNAGEVRRLVIDLRDTPYIDLTGRQHEVKRIMATLGDGETFFDRAILVEMVALRDAIEAVKEANRDNTVWNKPHPKPATYNVA